MSAFRALAARRAPIAFAQRAPFHASALRGAAKESHLHDENRAEEVQKKKEELLQKQKQGKGHWEEDLASDSESIVKADRSEGQTNSESIKKLQEETAKVAGDKART